MCWSLVVASAWSSGRVLGPIRKPGPAAGRAPRSHRCAAASSGQCTSRTVPWNQRSPISDQRAHSNRKLRFQGFCRSIRLIERVFWSFYSTVRSYRHYWLAFLWPYNLLSDKVLRITVYSCANAPAGPSRQPGREARSEEVSLKRAASAHAPGRSPGGMAVRLRHAPGP